MMKLHASAHVCRDVTKNKVMLNTNDCHDMEPPTHGLSTQPGQDPILIYSIC